MSDKLRQLSYNGETIYLNMNRSDYKKAQKDLQGAEAQSVFNGLRNKKGTVSSNDKYEIAQASSRDYAGDTDDVGLDRGQDKMQTKKEYKNNREEYEAALKKKFKAAGMSEKDAAKAAKKEAKALVEVEKAADEVLASEYFLPGQEQAFKEAKADAKQSGKNPVMLTKEDMELLQSPEFAEAWEDDGNGSKKLNSDKLKIIAANMVGDDNTIDNEERVQLTGRLRGYADNQKVTHRDARKTKNLFKHLGFDHEHDFTETKKIAAIVGGALTGAGLGAAIGSLFTSTVTNVIAEGAKYILHGNTVTTPDIVEKSTKNHWLPGMIAGAGTGALVGTAIASGIDDIKDHHYHKPAEQPLDIPPSNGVPEADPIVEQPEIPEGQPLPNLPEVATQPKPVQNRGRAVDKGLIRKGGFVEESWKESIKPGYEENNSNMKYELKSQFTIADQHEEIDIDGDDIMEPDKITLKDDTNRKDGEYNTHTYRKLTPEEVANKKIDGKTIQLVGNGPFYVLESVTNPKGESIKANHIEVYALKVESETDETGQTYRNYDLRQEQGMSGYGKSSINWAKRR